MKCDSFREAMVSDVLKTLEEREALELRTHLDGCAECRAEAANVKELEGALRRTLRAVDDRMSNTRSETKTSGISGGIRPVLTEAIKGNKMDRKRSNWISGIAAAAVAAGLLIFLLATPSSPPPPPPDPADTAKTGVSPNEIPSQKVADQPPIDIVPDPVEVSPKVVSITPEAPEQLPATITPEASEQPLAVVPPEAPKQLAAPAIPDVGPPVRASINLLKLIDLKTDVRHGDFAFEGGTLLITPRRQYGQVTRVQLPYEPPEDYDIDMVVERTGYKRAAFKGAGSSISLIMVHTGKQAVVAIDDTQNDGSSWSSIWNGGTRQSTAKRPTQLLKNGKPVNILWSVRKDHFRVFVNGEQILYWNKGFGKFHLNHNFRLLNRKALGLATFGAQYKITRLTLKPISGKGRPTR